MRLQGKTAIVTGGGSGIGREIACVFAREGAAVAIADIDPATATATTAQIQHDGGRAISLQVDVTQEAHVQRMVSEVLGAFGTIDVLINNAGVNAYETTIDTGLETWNLVIQVNLTGAFLCAKHVIPVMKKRGRGAIVNIASLAGLVGGAGMAAYTASKGGLISFTKALAIDHGSDGIRANCICPSLIRRAHVGYLRQEPSRSERGTPPTREHPLGRAHWPARGCRLCRPLSCFGGGLVRDWCGTSGRRWSTITRMCPPPSIRRSPRPLSSILSRLAIQSQTSHISRRANMNVLYACVRCLGTDPASENPTCVE